MLAQVEWGIGAEGGRRAVASCARDGFAALLRSPDWLCGLVLLAEPVAALGTPEQASGADRRARAHADRNAVMDDAWAAFGPVARPLGVLAAAAGRRDEAVAQLRARGRARRALGRAGLGARRARRPGCAVAPDAGDRVRDRALALARALELPGLATEIGAARLDDDAVGLDRSPREVVLGGDRVAAAAPALAPEQRTRKPLGRSRRARRRA